MEKTMKITAPEGYVIDKEKSTFENVVFKKIDDYIRWNDNLKCVEIKENNLHFIVSSQPSMAMSWDDAVRYYKGNKVWQLPTREQLQLVAKYIDKVNALINANGGYEIQGWHWTVNKHDEFCAWFVSMGNGYTGSSSKRNNFYVRAVSAL